MFRTPLEEILDPPSFMKRQEMRLESTPMEDALQLEAAIRELELIGKSSRLMSNFSSVRIVPRILIAMTVYFVTVLRRAMPESASVVLQ